MEDFDMNHPPSGSLFLSKAIPGFINYKTAEGLTLRTIDSHERLLNKWLEHIGDQQIGKINTQDVSARGVGRKYPKLDQGMALRSTNIL
jgi:hypothetical protein